MLHNYRRFLGRPFQPPHGCFRLVAQVFEEEYGVDLSNQDAGLDPTDIEGRMARLHKCLAELGREVYRPKEKDVILIRSTPFHIGVVVDEKKMLHSYSGGEACIEDFTTGRWRNRVEGFWRYNEW